MDGVVDRRAEVRSSEFDEWVAPHLGVMRRLAAVAAADIDPDDIVQEALIRAWRKRPTFDPARGSVRTWLLALTADQAYWRSGSANSPWLDATDLIPNGRASLSNLISWGRMMASEGPPGCWGRDVLSDWFGRRARFK